jgi:hypothetical protein
MVKKEDPKFCTIQEASNLTGFSTLRNMADEKTIGCIKTRKGHQRFDISSIQKMYGSSLRERQPETNQLSLYWSLVKKAVG